MASSKPVKYFHTDLLHRKIYATDASVYRVVPEAVAYPENEKDIIALLQYARTQDMPLIPRAAGTSLAGQVVGKGIIADVSRHMTRILDFDRTRRTVTVQPGVIRDSLNDYLRPYGLFFSPNTSTSNRCTIGGMTANNSAGSTSIRYGVTRDKIVRIRGVLADGTPVTFEALTERQWNAKKTNGTPEGNIYLAIDRMLRNEKNRELILRNFPPPTLHRRNMGYALDSLLQAEYFGGSDPLIPIQKLFAGSEGTLLFFTEITLLLDPLPPPHRRVIAAHYDSLDKALHAVPASMQHELYMCELMDDVILEQTRHNRKQSENRFFIQGNPAAVLLLEVAANDKQEADKRASQLIDTLTRNNPAYATPVLYGDEIRRALELRAAGLGLLGNIVGDTKPVACIEDTAVPVEELPDYISDFKKRMLSFGQKSVYYAHAGAGELHLRPMLNMKKSKDVEMFEKITREVARLVKKYRGSMSGEHGDGRLRSGLLPMMLGEETYRLLVRTKEIFDPGYLLNPGKIVHPEPMTSHLRYEPDRKEPLIPSKLDFTDSLGILRNVEKCNGSADCRKLTSSGGNMCPSYRASRDEKNTTRARANALREFLTHSSGVNPFDHEELYEIFDLCLSCKACATECPSSVDIATLKAEFLYQYQKIHGIPFRTKIIANSAKINRYISRIPGMYRVSNALSNTDLFKKITGIARERRLPAMQPVTFGRWLRGQDFTPSGTTRGKLYLFVDEFTNYYDVDTGKYAFRLLRELGYEITVLPNRESGRTYLSKGLLDQAAELAGYHTGLYAERLTDDTVLVGIEPSAVLVFKDEYLRLASDKESAAYVAERTYTLEGFLTREYKAGRITQRDFHSEEKHIHIHAHCHQKSLTGTGELETALSMPEHYRVTVLPTGCCGMAGAFGYEKEHYVFSMKVGESETFPHIRQIPSGEVLSVSGTSCRHQISDGAGRTGIHTAEILYRALARKQKKTKD